MMWTQFRATTLRRLLPSVLAAVAAASLATSASAAVVIFEIDPNASVIDLYGSADLTADGFGIVPFEAQGPLGIPSNVPGFSDGLSAQFEGWIKADVTGGSITFLPLLAADRANGLDSGSWAPELGGGPAGTTIGTVGSDPAVYGNALIGGLLVTALRDFSFNLGGTTPLAGGTFPNLPVTLQADSILELTDNTGVNAVTGPTSAPLPLPPIPNFLAADGSLTGTAIGDTITIPIGLEFSFPLGTTPVTFGLTGVVVGTVIPEPTSFALAGLGMLGLVFRRRRRA